VQKKPVGIRGYPDRSCASTLAFGQDRERPPHVRTWHEAGFFGAAASLSVYWGFKRPDQHFGYDAVRDEVDGASQGIEVP